MKTYSDTLLSRPWFAPASLAVVTGAFFVEFLFSRAKFLPYRTSSELVMQWYPYLGYWTAMLQAGDPPLWAHNLMAGFPLGAFPPAGMFYPLFLVFPAAGFAKGFTLLIFIEAECQMLLLYGLLREWGCSRYASWLGSAAFGLAGFSLHSAGYLPMHDVLTWMPGIFWFGLRLSRRKMTLDFLALVLFCSLGYLAGELETLIFLLTVLLVFLLAGERAGLVRTGLTAAAMAASLLICAGPFLLSENYLAHSLRGAGEFNPVVTSWKGIAGCLTIMIPAMPGGKLVYWSYAGFLLPFGFFAGLGRAEGRRLRRLTLFIIIVSIIYAINLWPLSYLFNSLPVLRYESFDMRFRLIYPSLLLMLLGAGESFDRLNEGTGPGRGWGLIGFTGIFLAAQGVWLAVAYRQTHEVSAIAASRLVLAAALLFLGYRVWTKGRKQGLIVIRPSALLVILGLDLFALSWLGLPRTDPAIFKPSPAYFSQGPRLVPERAHLLSLFNNNLETWLQVRLDRGPGWICGYIRNGLERQDRVLSRLEGLSFSNFNYHAIRPDTRALLDYLAIKEVAADKTPVLLAGRVPLLLPVLKSSYHEKGLYKGPRPGQGAQGLVMPAGSEWALTMDLVPGDGLEMEVRPESAGSEVEVKLGQGAAAVTLSWADARPVPDEPGRKKLLLPAARPGEFLIRISIGDAGGAAATLIGPEIENDLRPYREVKREKSTIIYINREALDLYGLYTAVDTVDDARALDYLFDPERFAPERRLMLAPGDVDPRIPGQAARPRQAGDVAVRAYSNNRVVLETGLATPCWLSIAESYYPGWRAWVDGVEKKIIRADYAYQALALETAGPHRIELRFIPAEFRVGLWASLVSAASFLLMAGLRALRGGTRDGHGA